MKKFIVLFIAFAVAVASCTKEAPAPTLELTSGTEYTVSSTGGTVNVRFKTNQDDWGYELGSTSSWISAEKGSGVLSLSVAENDKYEERIAEFSIFAPSSGSNRASATIKIRQAAKAFVPEITFTPASPLNVKAEAADYDITVNTNLSAWVYESDASWLTGSVNGNVLKLSVAQTTKELDRTGTITFYAPTKESYEATATLKVVQSGVNIEYPLTTLSTEGTSNCYLITHMGEYCFDATVKGNGKGCKGLAAPEKMSPAGAKLVWQTENETILSVSLQDGKIHFVAGKKPGNALIAATDAAGNIIWSWHIWRPDVEITGLESKSGAYVMNLNLGATTDSCTDLGSYGLLYQWGRKDPFPGSPVMNGGSITTANVNVYDIDGKVVKIEASDMYSTTANTLAYSIAHPTVCLSNSAQYKTCRDWLTPAESNPSLWGNPDGNTRVNSNYSNNGTKSFYDPCPLGWRVAPISAFIHLTSTGGMVWATGDAEGVMTWQDIGGKADFLVYDYNHDGLINLLDFTDGWWLYLSKVKGIRSFFPATTRYDGQYAMLMGSMVGLWGNYWYNTADVVDGKDEYLGVALSFGIKEYGSDSYTVTASPLSNGSRADAYAVRCIKE